MSGAEAAIPHTAQAMWRSWIAPQHLLTNAIIEVREQVHDDAAAVFFEDFFLGAPFTALSQAVRMLDWERMMVVRDSPSTVRATSSEEFEAIDPSLRFSSHERAIRLDQAIGKEGILPTDAQRILRFFFAFAVMTPALSSWVSEVMGQDRIKATSVEFARYDKGDFIAEHTDVAGRRVANMVIYFHQPWPVDGGGKLFVKDRVGKVCSHEPKSNSAVLLPLDPAHSHWVSPWSSETGRYTVSISFSRDEP